MKNFFNICIKILIKDLSVPISNTGGVSLSVENLWGNQKMVNIVNLSYKENGTLNDAYYLKEINLNLPSCGLVIFTSDDKKSYLSLIKILVGLYTATKESKIIIDSEDFTKLKGEAKLSYINTNIGFISENSLLNPDLTVIDSIKLNSFLLKEEIDSTLEKLNLSLIRNKIR